MRTTYNRGESHGRAILTEAEVIRLRENPVNRAFVRRLLKKVSYSGLYLARSGYSWRHLNRKFRPTKGGLQ